MLWNVSEGVWLSSKPKAQKVEHSGWHSVRIDKQEGIISTGTWLLSFSYQHCTSLLSKPWLLSSVTLTIRALRMIVMHPSILLLHTSYCKAKLSKNVWKWDFRQFWGAKICARFRLHADPAEHISRLIKGTTVLSLYLPHPSHSPIERIISYTT